MHQAMCPMATATALAGVFAGVFVDAHAPRDDDGVTPTWALSIPTIPVLIVVTTIILSLEIFELALASRGLATMVMMLMWGGLLSAEAQASAIISAALYHCVREAYIEWTLGFPAIFQPRRARKITLWSLFWVRVFVWGATLVAAGATADAQWITSFADSVSEMLPRCYVDVFGSALIVMAYCECIEVLLLLYLAEQNLPYVWRRRVLLWVLALFIGALHATGHLACLVQWVLVYAAPYQGICGLIMVMWMSMRVPWDQVWVAARQALGYAVPALTKKTPRRSILYRSNSEVEVVKMQSEEIVDTPDTKYSLRSKKVEPRTPSTLLSHQ